MDIKKLFLLLLGLGLGLFYLNLSIDTADTVSLPMDVEKVTTEYVSTEITIEDKEETQGLFSSKFYFIYMDEDNEKNSVKVKEREFLVHDIGDTFETYLTRDLYLEVTNKGVIKDGGDSIYFCEIVTKKGKFFVELDESEYADVSVGSNFYDYDFETTYGDFILGNNSYYSVMDNQ